MNGGACPSSERGLAVLKGWEASLRSRYTVLSRPCFSFCSFSGQVSWSPRGIYPPDWSRVCVYMLLVQISKPCRSSSQPRDPSYSCFIPTLKRWCSKCRTAPGVLPCVLQRTPHHSVWAGARGLLCISCRIGERCGLAAFGEPGGKLTNLHSCVSTFWWSVYQCAPPGKNQETGAQGGWIIFLPHTGYRKGGNLGSMVDWQDAKHILSSLLYAASRFVRPKGSRTSVHALFRQPILETARSE